VETKFISNGVTYQVIDKLMVSIDVAHVVGSGHDAFFVGWIPAESFHHEYMKFDKNGENEPTDEIRHPFHRRHRINHCRVFCENSQWFMAVLEELDENGKPVKCY
jgi:hypothetical protein